MERSLGFLLMLIIHIVQAQSQEGFISLDCGLPANETSSYKEEKTGLQFSSDATFIQSGKTSNVEANRENDLPKPFRTLRYFPDGIRNCYNLIVEKGRKYLIRARFIYGNYDGRDISPKFDMYIGPNLWVKIDLERRVNGTREEILHIPTSDSLQICLVKNGTTTPVITTLELRPMGKDSYIVKSGSLKLSFRGYLTNSTSGLRYPHDVFDRQWTAYFKPEWTPISTASNVVASNYYELPEDALTTAATPTIANAPLMIEWPSPNPDDCRSCKSFSQHISNAFQIPTQIIVVFNRNLSGNNLNGSLPQAFKSVEGNPWLFIRKPPKNKVLVAIVASVACVGIVIAVLVLFLVVKKKNPTILQVLHLLPWTSSTKNDTFVTKKSRRFTYSEVINMTNNFQSVLGKGGFGMVYHGTVNGSEQVAVKTLSQSSTQGYIEFKAEVDLLLRVHHTNLVSLVGYCYEGDHLALVYEFLPNGDLKQHLSGKGGRSIIIWSTRLRIALEAALGLEYLHIGCTPPMVHRDVKTANILLDENFKAKIADFGLSRSFQGGGESEDLSVIAGTPGYLDPEYFRASRLSKKSDVYSFGVVLLEMITNQPVINQTSENSHITQWVGFKVNRGDISEIMDPNLCGVYDYNSAWRAVELAMSCADPSSSERPTKSYVINELKECLVSENSRMSKNQGLESQEMSISVDTSVVPRAR